MTAKRCSREHEIVEGLRTKSLTVDQTSHLETCGSCRQAVRVAGWLQELSRSAGAGGPIPEASSIWWRSRVVREMFGQEKQIERRTSSLMLVQALATLLVVITLAGLALSSETVRSIVGAFVRATGAADPMTAIPVVLIGAALVALGAGAIVVWGTATELR